MLKCFVACAFGKNDVDAIYKKAIVKVLKDKKIIPLRVDNIEHNSNIDLKIIELINQSDFCIADLTYARPSVYYEAGYSTGLKHPVIYTVRKDHFSAKQEDIAGNLKVHFDLQMKNIIDWSSTVSIATFKTRLVKRFELICKPLWEREKISNEIAKEKSQFEIMSIHQRLRTIKEVIQNIISQGKWNPYYKDDYFKDSNDIDYYFKGKKIISFLVVKSATKNILSDFSVFYLKELDHLIENGYECHYIMVSLRKIPNSRVEDVFPHADNIEYCKILKAKTYKKAEYYIHFISGLGYANDYLNELQYHLKQISNSPNKL